MDKIVNLTQHPATSEQIDAGVFDMPADRIDALHALLTFSEIPDAATLRGRACCIAGLVTTTVYGDDEPLARFAMIGGAPYLMALLEKDLAERRIKSLYAFSTREITEVMQADGSIKKTAISHHSGFVEGGATAKRTDVSECQEAQNILDSEPMVFCPICGGSTRTCGSSSDNCNLQGVWHDYDHRVCRNCNIEFYVYAHRDESCPGTNMNGELCQGTIEPRFGTPKKNIAIERFFEGGCEAK